MLTIKRAVTIAQDWHDSQGAALYSFSSCNGYIKDEDMRRKMIREIKDCLKSAHGHDVRSLTALLRHIESRQINRVWEVQGDYGYGDGHECLTTEFRRLAAHNALLRYSQNDRHVRSLRIRVKHERIAQDEE